MSRSLDIVLSAVGLAVLSPLLALIALIVKVTTPGGALFTQERVGLHGVPFRIHKFRTMRAGTPGPSITSAHDPRITKVGEWLRRTKLDELPQLYDVLVGTMSLVGPRPEMAEYVALWNPAHREVILSVRPGITDPASVELRHESDELAASGDPQAYYEKVLLPRKTALYVDYVQHRTPLGDIKTLLQTIRAVARHSPSAPS